MIGIYGLDGRLQAELDGSRMCCGDYDPVWSPDGAASIIVKESGTSGPVWELPVDGGTPRRVTPEDPRTSMAFLLRPPAYSPDRTRAAFIVPWERGELVVTAADGTLRQVLIEADPSQGLIDDQTLVWSATGDRIAYVLSRDVGHDAAGNVTLVASDLWVVDSRTGTAMTLASARGSGPLRPFGFSPSGDRIVFGQTDADASESLWSVSTDGQDAPLLLSGTEFPGPDRVELVGLSPEGDRMLITDQASLWSVNTDGSGSRMLVAGAGRGAWVSLPDHAENPIKP